MGREFGLNFNVIMSVMQVHDGFVVALKRCSCTATITIAASDAWCTVKPVLGMHAEVHASQCQSCGNHERCDTQPWAYASVTSNVHDMTIKAVYAVKHT